ncbi:hypothetical protein CAOG_07107 [Capsaspora owczarzaki ATCC 30864]|uniref:hypothetical protein n=1 Tax=Capsaspora owczarzaki (strain ATCC 30864) TaxID=595528 RepID=UPI0001FE3458|nr:hypothetical protein CAOG_07107 [Capsaspora owczarzaki ATCC 30864]|eukprot:XP_004343831.1 hypothetical protein CAOG_07107 [Capsaspora owczarzaki ATCC 30864]
MAAPEEEDFSKLSLEDRLSHKSWKCRLQAYEETTKLISQMDDPASDKLARLLPAIRKMPLDANAVAQEKAMDTVYAFAEFAACAPQATQEVVQGIAKKCLNAREKTKQRAIECCLMLIEVDKSADAVVTELLPALADKLPKTVAIAASVLARALREFGPKVVPFKPLMREAAKLFDHGDGSVRAEAKALVIELYRYLGPMVIKPVMESLKPVTVKELEAVFEDMPKTPAVPERLLRAEQAKRQAAAPTLAAGDGSDGADSSSSSSAEPAPLDPYDLMDPVNVLEKVPPNFFNDMGEKKWQLRKEALEALHQVASSPKLAVADYNEIVRTLKTAIGDINVLVVALAATCIADLATGLRSNFAPYAPMLVAELLNKFKEKKATVVTSVRAALDALYPSMSIPDLQEDIAAAVDNKNPSVRSETLLWVARFATVTNANAVPKAAIRPFIATLLKGVDDSQNEVREAAMEAVGTLLKLFGERALGPLLEPVDSIKRNKINEFCQKAEVKGGAPGSAPKPAVSAASAPPAASTSSAAAAAAAAPKARSAPASASAPRSSATAASTSAAAKPAAAKSTTSAAASSASTAAPGKRAPAAAAAPAGAKKSAAGGAAASASKDDLTLENALSPEQVEEMATTLLPEAIRTQLVSANWKERLEAATNLEQLVQTMAPADIQAEVVTRFVDKKPGLKDVNTFVLAKKFDVLAVCAQRAASFTRRTVTFGMEALVEKLSDVKCRASAANCLTAYAERTSLNLVSQQLAGVAIAHKNPKVSAEALLWLSTSINEFGIQQVTVKSMVELVKKSLANANQAVRASAVQLLATMRVWLGPDLRASFEEEKGALLTTIDAEFAKVADQRPPAPTRGPRAKKVAAPSAFGEEAEGGSGAADDGAEDGGVEDLLPRNDISGQITAALLTNLGDANWKVRGEALEQITQILQQAQRRITPDIGSLPTGLKARLSDANKNLVTITLNMLGVIATAMGPEIERHMRILMPSMLSTLSDAKPQLRQAAITAIDAWEQLIGLDPFITGQYISSALAGDAPLLRKDLLSWLEQKLTVLNENVANRVKPKKRSAHSPKAVAKDFEDLAPAIFSCLEDRSQDVRKAAQAALGQLMVLLGYDSLVRATGGLKPANKTSVMQLLTKLKSEVKLPTPAAAVVAEPAASSSASASSSSSSTLSASAPAASSPAKRGAAAAPAAAASEAPPAALKKSSASTAGSSSAAAASSGAATALAAGSGPGVPASLAAAADENAPPLLLSSEKDARLEKDRKARWTFESPRPEFVELLKEQLQPIVSKAIFTQLLSQDAKHHMVALNVICDCIRAPPPRPDVAEVTHSLYEKEAINAADVLFKYASIRFFDNNTTTFLKLLELIQLVIANMDAASVMMTDYEAGVLLPFLVFKIADPKDSVRKEIRGIFRQICNVFPPSKLFANLMEGAKSKSSIVRRECLEEICQLIQRNGVTVCHPSHTKVLPMLAGHIADRDSNVRLAALNCIVEAHLALGDGIWKLLGDISAKDKAMLEERIKRSGSASGAARPAAAAATGRTAAAAAAGVSSSGSPSKLRAPGHLAAQTGAAGTKSPSKIPTLAGGASVAAKQPSLSSSSTAAAASVAAIPSSSPAKKREFSLDLDKLGLANGVPEALKKMPVLAPTADAARDALSAPVPTLPTRSRPLSSAVPAPTARSASTTAGSTLLASRLARPPMASSIRAPAGSAAGVRKPTPTTTATTTMRPATATATAGAAVAAPATISAHLVGPMRDMTSSDLNVGVNAMKVFEGVLKDAATATKELSSPATLDGFVTAATMQLRLTFTTHLGSKPGDAVLRSCKHLLNALMLLSAIPQLMCKLSREVLYGLVLELTHRMLDEKRLLAIDNGQPSISKAMNVLTIKTLDNCDQTLCFGVLLDILKLSVTQDTSKEAPLTQLVMKCLWKQIKLLGTLLPKMNTDQLLLDLHLFLVAHPPASWKQRADDTPLRTVKTVLNGIVKSQGAAVLEHLTLIPDREHSHVTTYLMAMLAAANIAVTGLPPLPAGVVLSSNEPAQPTEATRAENVSAEQHELLVRLVDQASVESSSEDALQQLASFQAENPGISLEPYLATKSEIVRDYVTRNVAELQMSEGVQEPTSTILPPIEVDAVPATENVDSTSLFFGVLSSCLVRCQVLTTTHGE